MKFHMQFYFTDEIMNILSLYNIFLTLGIFFYDVIDVVIGAQIPYISKLPVSGRVWYQIEA